MARGWLAVSGGETERCRLDVWLWRARFFKTRALAAAAVSGGAVRVERGGQSRAVDKPGYGLCVGDGVSVRSGPQLRIVTVLALGVRRGPPAEARSLYRLDEGDASSDDGDA